MDNLPIPLRPSLTCYLAAHDLREPVAQVTALLALEGPVTLLDGANATPAYRILRLIAARTPEPEVAMSRVYVRRAFTCYQMIALLDGTPALPQPHIILDPLSTFYDDQVPLREIERLLAICQRHIERLSLAGPVLVALHPPQTRERAFLVDRLCAQADRLIAAELPGTQVLQPVLF
jgi:hypothetical protein